MTPNRLPDYNMITTCTERQCSAAQVVFSWPRRNTQAGSSTPREPHASNSQETPVRKRPCDMPSFARQHIIFCHPKDKISESERRNAADSAATHEKTARKNIIA